MSQLVTVMEGLAELPNGKVIEVDSQRWFDWLDFEECRSFRFGDGATPYTCRKEKVKGVDGYWYAYRKVEGKLHKRYIGVSEALSMSRLTEVGEMLQVATTSKLPKALGNSKVEEQKLPNALGNLEAINSELHNEVTQLKAQLAEVRSQLSAQTAAQESKILELPDAATLLNQLKSDRKKSKADLGDVEAILELLPEIPAQQPQPQAQLPDLYAARDKLFEIPSLGGWRLEKGEKRERFWAFASALIEEASKLNPDYSIIQRLQSDLKQEREYSQGIAKGMSEEFTKRVNLEKKLGLRR